MAADQLYIRISDESKQRELSPQALDIRELQKVLSALEDLLYPNGRTAGKDVISLAAIESGSVNLAVDAAPHAIASASTLLSQAEAGWGVERIPPAAAAAIERLQKLVRKRNLRIAIGRGQEDPLFQLTPKTRYYRASSAAYLQQTILYGEVVDIGGEKPPKLKLRTREYGILTLTADAELLTEPKDNILYQARAVHAEGSWDEHSQAWKQLKMLKWEPYERLTHRALDAWLENRKPSGWDGLDADQVIKDIRSYTCGYTI